MGMYTGVPALQIHQQDPIGEYAKLVALQNSQQQAAYQRQMQPLQLQQEQQQVQAQAQQLAIRQRDMQNMHDAGMQAATKDADGNITGLDYNKYFSLLRSKGTSTDVVNNAEASYTKALEQHQLLDKQTRENQAADRNEAFQHIQGIKGLTGSDRQDAIQAAAQWMISRKMDPSQYLPLLQTDDGLKKVELELGMYGQIQADAEKQAGLAEKQAQTNKANREAAYGSGAMGDWVSSHLAAQNLPATPANIAKAQEAYNQATRVLPAQVRVETAATGGGGILTDQALDLAAENYYKTGQMPNLYRAPGAMAKVINRAAELHPTGDLATNKAAYEANKKSLDNVTTTLDMLTGFESAANKNLQMFMDKAQKVVDSGSPWANRPLREIEKSALGNEDQAAYEAARGVAQREIARVVNNPKLTGVLTNEARQELNSYNPISATLGQTLSVAKVLQQDMANVHAGLSNQKADIMTRLKGVQQPQSQGPGQTITHRYNPSTGKIEAVGNP